MESNVFEFARLVVLSAESGTLKNAVLASPINEDVEKIRFEVKNIAGGSIIQAEYFLTEGRVKQENLDFSAVENFICEKFVNFKRAELNDSGGTASLLKSKKGKITILKNGKIGSGALVKVKENNREKNYILSGSEDFLKLLDISDKNGRVYDKKQSKFRQINRFLENLRDVTKYLPDDEIIVADLCCGKSYLSFAVYYYLTYCLGRKVIMHGMDLKQSVMDYCSEVAKKCGFVGMHFEAGDVTKFAPEKAPHLVISLHACDTATDIVIDKGISLGAKVILSTPCCHRELSRNVSAPELQFISKHSILKSKFCDAATDALRILRLECCGYNCAAIELIDPDDTPKNVLIRAIKKNSIDYAGASNKNALEKYNSAYKFLTGKEAPELPV